MKHFILSPLVILFFLQISHGNTAKTAMRHLSNDEIVADMGAGWNLGNSLDSKCSGMDAETCWGNPRTTQATIDAVAQRGFKTLRLPVTWNGHLGSAPNYTIDKAWLDRVEEVANYAFANDMYVIINTHHEGDWLIPTNAKKAEVSDKLSKLWAQIAARFKDYGDYLIFEPLNEPRLEGSDEEWSGGTAEGRACVNHYHQISVDAIRAAGGNNLLRKLMIATYAASTTPVAMTALVIPNNDMNAIVAVHSYFPYLYCLETASNWGSAEDYDNMNEEFDLIYDTFIAKGHAVVMGEWGATNHYQLADRLRHGGQYVRKCREKGICPVYWDNGKASEFGLLGRSSLVWDYGEYADTILNAYAYRPCTEVDMNSYVAVKGGDFVQSASALVHLGDNVRIKAEFSLPSSALWTLPDGTTASGNELNLTDVGFAHAGTYRYEPTDATYCKGSASVEVAIDVYQAEDFVQQSGLQTEPVSDDGGGLNIGFIDNGDWSTYTIRVDKTALYRIDARVATNVAGGTIDFLVGGEVQATLLVETSPSGGWQSWYTARSSELVLEKGVYELKLSYKGGTGALFNLNWFDIVFLKDVQYLDVRTGWNLVSSYLQTQPRPIAEVFPHALELKTQDGFYSASQPAFLNSLAGFSGGTAYLVNNTKDEKILITGTEIPFAVPVLSGGWNLAGVSSSTPIPVAQLAGAQAVKDLDRFYMPALPAGTLSELKPGKAYFILK